MSGRIISDKKICKMLLKDLMDNVKECQNVYGKNKTLLATENDARLVCINHTQFCYYSILYFSGAVLFFITITISYHSEFISHGLICFCFCNNRILRLCETWEICLSHGLKTTSVFKNIVSGSLTESTTFWDFAFKHLTSHEKERFTSLRYGV